MKQLNLFGRRHNFFERLNFSEGVDSKTVILEKIMNDIPGAVRLKKSEINQDKDGTDWWIIREGNLRPISIDMKNREFCPIKKFGSDDACIETTSVYKGEDNGIWEDKKRIKIGWTLDIKKQTDYIIYTWPNQGKLRYWILPFPFLCTAANRNLEIWKQLYKERPALNPGYITLAIYPPRTEITKAMREIMYGTV